MKRYILALLILLLAFSNADAARLRREGDFRFYTLDDVTDIDTEKAAHIYYADDLQQEVGGASLNSVVSRENFNAVQGTAEFWLKPNWDSDDGLRHWVFASGNTGQFIRFIHFDDGRIYFELKDKDLVQHGVNLLGNWTAGTWYHIVCIWDFGADTAKWFLDGVLRGTITTLSNDSIDSIDATVHIGLRPNNTARFNGSIAGKISKRPYTAAEVTAAYNSGDGNTSTFTVDQDTVALFDFTQEGTGIIYHPSGKTVSDISNGATESTLTTAAGSDTAFADNEAVLVEDGTGYSVFGSVDGTPTDTSVDVDDGAGALVSNIEKVGVSIDGAGGAYEAVAANSSVHDVGLEDLGFSAWVKSPDDSYTYDCIVTNRGGGADGYYMFLLKSGRITSIIYDGVDDYTVNGTTDIRDDLWHHVAGVIDRDNAANCKVYLDGYDDTSYRSGTLGDIGSLSNNDIFEIGGFSIIRANGRRRDILIAYPADIMAAGEMGEAGAILALATNPLDVASQPNSEDYWPCTENTGTTINGDNNNLTLSDAAAWSQEAFLTRNHWLDGNQENGGIGGVSAGSNQTITKDTSVVKYDGQSLKDVFSAADDNDESTLATMTLTSGGDYVYRFWLYVSAIHASSNLFLDIDGSATPIHTRQLDTGTDDMGTSYATGTWLYLEGSFEADQILITLKLRITGAGPGTNSATVYVDEGEVLPQLVTQPGCEAADGNALPTGWSDTGTPDAGETQTDTAEQHSGASSILLNNCDANEGVTQDVTVVVDQYYTFSFWEKNNAQDIDAVLSGAATATIDATGDNTWTKHDYSFKAAATTLTIEFVSGAANQSGWIDDVTVTRLDTRAANTASKTPSFYPKRNPLNPGRE